MNNAGRHILSIRGLDVSYGDVQAVRGFSLDVEPGQIVGLVGESGSGKSSVLRAVAGLLGRSGAARAERALFRGEDLMSLPPSKRAQLLGADMAYVFQDPVQALDPLFTVGYQFDECFRAHGKRLDPETRALQEDLLRQMGFEDPARVLAAYPHNLSGGMCQRVALAFAVAGGPALLLADEPTSALDVAAQRQVSDLLLRIRADFGTAMVVVSHNIGAVSLVADRIGVMYRGELVEEGAADQVLHAPAHPYTQSLIAAVPRADGSLPQVVEWQASDRRAAELGAPAHEGQVG